MSENISREAVLPAALAPDVGIWGELTHVHAHEGAVALGLQAEAYLRGIWLALAYAVGVEAAYATMQRPADEAAEEIAMKHG